MLNVSVVPDARREGLGRALLERFMRDAAQRGAEQIFLEVRVGNAPAIGLYGSAGFVAGRPARRVLPRRRRAARTRTRWCCAARCRRRGAGGA